MLLYHFRHWGRMRTMRLSLFCLLTPILRLILFLIVSLCNWYFVRLVIILPFARNCSNWLAVYWSMWKEVSIALHKLIIFPAGRIRSILSIALVLLLLAESYHPGSTGAVNQH